MMNKNGKKNKGFTFVEMLLCVLLVGLLTLVVAAGSKTALDVYRQSVRYAESRVLSATLLKAMENELCYADDLKENTIEGEKRITFTSASYGNDVFFLVNDKGRICVQKQDSSTLLLGEKMYPNGLGVESLEITVSSANEVQGSYGKAVKITLKMKDGNTVETQFLNVNIKK